MEMVGRKIQSIYSRYAISDEGMLKNAASSSTSCTRPTKKRKHRQESKKALEKQAREMAQPRAQSL
jgi:hypothetical protein